MEPMTLGSPPTSPSSSYSPFYQNQANVMGTPGLGSAPHTHNGFLPGYLMGEYTQQVIIKYVLIIFDISSII